LRSSTNAKVRKGGGKKGEKSCLSFAERLREPKRFSEERKKKTGISHPDRKKSKAHLSRRKGGPLEGGKKKEERKWLQIFCEQWEGGRPYGVTPPAASQPGRRKDADGRKEGGKKKKWLSPSRLWRGRGKRRKKKREILVRYKPSKKLQSP